MHGLYVLWWMQERHVPAAAIAIILAASDLVLLALEVPSGWFADRFGHVRSLIVGSVAQVLGMVGCWLAGDVVTIVVASTLIAAGDAFRSGADQALIYRSCVASGRPHAFQPLQARMWALESAALVVLILVGGAIVTRWGFAAGWATEIALCAAGVLIACAFREPPPAPDVADDRGTGASDAAPPIRGLLAVIAPAACVGALESCAAFLARTDASADASGITAIIAAIAFAEAAGSLAATRVHPRTRTTKMMLVASVALFAAAVIVEDTIWFVAPGLAFLLGVMLPLRSAAIQHLAADSIRARAASLASACDMALSLIALPLAGRWRGRPR